MVYVILFQEGTHVREKLLRICDSFLGQRFDIPGNNDVGEIKRRIDDLTRKIDDVDAVLRNTTTELRGFLRQVQLISQHPNAVENSISLLELYKMFLNKEKILFTTLNKLKQGEKLATGFCWIPKCEQGESFRKIEGIKERNRNIEVPTFKLVSDHTVKPPTMFKNNEFTIVF